MRKSTQKGNTTVLSLITLAAMTSAIYFTTSSVINLQKRNVDLSKFVKLRMALHSTADYAINEIKHKHCLTEQFLPDPDCTLDHPRNIERLLLSLDQVNFLKQAQGQGSNSSSDPQLSLMQINVNLNSMTSSHPLYPIIKEVLNVDLGQNEKITHLNVILEREKSAFLPHNGSSYYLRLKAQFLNNNKQVATYGNQKMSVSSLLTIFPRELNSYALIIANNLYLDRNYNAPNQSTGSVSLHNFASKPKSFEGGLIFQSPVFVNHDVYLPKTKTEDSNESFTPVTFSQKIFIGNGKLYSGDQEYAPTSQGGTDSKTWSDIKTFGGFLKGIEVDGKSDSGLDVLSGNTQATDPDTSLIRKCLQTNNFLTNTENLLTTELNAYLRSLSGDQNNQSRVYSLVITAPNRFVPQRNALPAPNVTKDDSFNASWKEKMTILDPNNQEDPTSAVTEVTFQIDFQNFIKAQMPMMSELSFEIPKNTSYQKMLTTQLKLKENFFSHQSDNLKDKKEKLSDLNSELKLLEIEKKEIEKLIAEQTVAETTSEPTPAPDVTPIPTPTPTPPPPKLPFPRKFPKNQIPLEQRLELVNEDISDVKSQILLTTNSINGTSHSIELLNSEIETLNKKISAFDALPTTKVNLNLSSRINNQSQFLILPNKANLSFSIENKQSLLNDLGQPILFPKILVQAFDSTYMNGRSILPFGQKDKLKASLNLTDDTIDITEEDMTDLAQQSETCESSRLASSSQSFGSADWGQSFAPMSKHSWNFAGTGDEVVAGDYLIENLILDEKNSSSTRSSFQVRSIVKNCIIKSGATFVSGFFLCENLNIETRTTPLKIRGTFIVTKKANIHPEAIKSGIQWSSVLNPESTKELRNNKILTPPPGVARCDEIYPVWNPYPTLKDNVTRYNCNPTSLKSRADPFTWTSVDPDCGLLPGKSNTTCKNRLIQFYVTETSRMEGQ